MEIKEAIKIIKRLIESVELVYKSNPLTDKEPHPETEALTLAISALEQERWIPVTERLPEDEYVLISKKPKKLSGSKWSVGIGIRTADQRSRKIQWRDSGFGIIQDDKVLAWRPLPAPYQEDEA